MMDIMRYEFKKMFRYRKGIVCLLLFILLKVVLLYFFDNPANLPMEENKQEYSWYLSQITGNLTDETRDFIEKEAAEMSDAAGTVQTTYEKYYDGQISEAELKKKVSPLMEKLKRRAGFDVVYQQYLFVRENPGNRYFLYTNGWDALLSHDSPDYLLILVLFLLLAPVYCEEGKCQMDILTATMKKGGTYLSRHKIIISGLITLFLCVSSIAVEILFCSIRYGLPHGAFPLQSLPLFGTSTKAVSLLQVLLLTIGLKTLGYFCLAVMVLFGTAFFRKYAVTLLVCSALTFLPIFGFSSAVRYMLPGPVALITASGFLIGDQTSVSSVTDEMVTTFQEIPGWVLGFVVASTMILCFALLMAIQKKFQLKWRRSPTVCYTMAVSSVVVSLLAGCLLTGCAYSKTYNRTVYNMADARYYETEQYLIYVDYNEYLDGILTVENKETGERTPLVRDVLQSSYQVMDCIYGHGNYVYYIKMTADKSEMILYEMYDCFLVQEVDLTDFSERTVFRVDLKEKNLLGSAFSAEKEDVSFFVSFFMGSQGFFVDEQYIYFISPADICRMDRVTGKKETLIETLQITDVAYDGVYIYYLNEKSELVQYSIAEKVEYVVPDVVAKRFYLYGDSLYFLNREKQGGICKMDMATYHISRLSDKTATWLVGDDTWLFFGNLITGEVFRIDADGSCEIQILCPENQVLFYYFPKASKLYLPSLTGDNMIVKELE